MKESSKRQQGRKGDRERERKAEDGEEENNTIEVYVVFDKSTPFIAIDGLTSEIANQVKDHLEKVEVLEVVWPQEVIQAWEEEEGTNE